VTTRKRIKIQTASDRQLIQDGAHYMRYALAVYGHLMYVVQNPCTAACCLTAGFLSCRGGSCCCGKADEGMAGGPIRVVGDNVCGCNELGFLLSAGLYHSEIVYASFKTSIKTCPYVIVVDKEKQAVVVAIKGTFSLESLVTDLNVRPELLELYSSECDVFAEECMRNEYCHSGMLHCALNIYKDLESHKTLDRLLLGQSPKLSGYSLVLTGHSLGAGCAAIAAIMLRNKFPRLRCLCFAPPGCVLSLASAQDNHITSYVLDSDLVPRMSLHSVVGLRNDVLEMIARVKVPKHIVLGRGTTKRNLDMVHMRESIPQSSYYDRVLEFNEHQNQLKVERNVPDVKLYLPGRIVHLVQNRVDYNWRRGTSYIPIWAERDDFAEIQLTKTLLSDHDPGRYLRCLTNIEMSIK
jgi:sn1-specific diacylglycerol lipase